MLAGDEYIPCANKSIKGNRQKKFADDVTFGSVLFMMSRKVFSRRRWQRTGRTMETIEGRDLFSLFSLLEVSFE